MAELKAKIGIDTTELQKGLDRAESEITGFLKKVDNIASIGQKLQSIGKSLTVGLSLPIAGLATASLNAFKELEGVRTAFERLNDPNLLSELRKATKNTTTDLQLMQSAVSAEKFGLSTSALPKLLEYARRVAKDTGQSVDYLVDSIVTGIGRKSPLILDNLGISATALKEALGGVSMEAASVGQVTEAVAKIATAEVEKMGAETLTLAESWAQVRTSVSNSLGKIGEIINKNFDISGIISKVTDFINRAITAFENLNPAIQKSILVVAGLAAAAGPLIAALGLIMASLPSIIAGFGALKIGLVALTSPIGLVTAGLIGIVAAVVTNWNKITPYLVRTANNFIQLYNESQTVRSGVLSIGFAFESLYEVVKSFGVSAYNAFKSFGKGILNLLEGISLMARGLNQGLTNGDWSLFQKGWTKANEKVALSFDNLGARIKNVEQKYTGLLANKKPLNFVTEADLTISNKREVVEIVEDEIQGAINSSSKPIQIELPDLEVIKGKGSRGFMDSLGNEFENFWEIDTFTGKLARDMEAAANVVAMGLNNVQLVASSKFVELSQSFNEGFNNLLQDALPDAFFDLFSSIGEAIGSGGNVLNAMGQSVLSSLGQFLSQLGKQFVAYGTAVALFGKSQIALLSPDPFTKIPAGLALAAAGAALAVAGGVIKGIAGGGGRGGSSSGGTFTPDTGVRSYSSSYGATSTGNGEVVFRISGRDLVGVLRNEENRNARVT